LALVRIAPVRIAPVRIALVRIPVCLAVCWFRQPL
jgi:hypothetical protein